MDAIMILNNAGSPQLVVIHLTTIQSYDNIEKK